MNVDTQALPLPSLEPRLYNQKDFVNREYELRQIQRKVDEGLMGYPITQPVIHLWGLRGVGKTWLLNHLMAKYRFVAGPKNGKEGTLCLLADFRAIELRLSAWEPVRITRLLESLVRQIEAQLGDKLSEVAADALAEFKAERQRLIDHDRDRDVNVLTERLVELLVRLSRHFVPLLLFDTVEKLDEDGFFWLESHVIEPIARTNGAIVVIVGRKEIPRWREFGVRQRLVVWELRPFSREGTSEQLTQLWKSRSFDQKEGIEQLIQREYGRLSDSVFFFSAGHPYINQVLGEALIELSRHQLPVSNLEETYRKEIATLLEALETRFLDEVDSEAHRRVLQILSTLRKFNIESARYMLGKLLDDRYERWPDAYFLRLFEDLEATNLVWWNSDLRGYVVAPPLRRLIELHLLIREDPPEHFTRRHATALKLYSQWMRRFPSDPTFIIEVLYHGANSLRDKGPDRVRDWISDVLDKVLDRTYLTTDGAHLLFQSIYRDADFQDTYEKVSRDAYDLLMRRIRLFRDSLAKEESVEGMHNENRVQASDLSA